MTQPTKSSTPESNPLRFLSAQESSPDIGTTLEYSTETITITGLGKSWYLSGEDGDGLYGPDLWDTYIQYVYYRVASEEERAALEADNRLKEQRSSARTELNKFVQSVEQTQNHAGWSPNGSPLTVPEGTSYYLSESNRLYGTSTRLHWTASHVWVLEQNSADGDNWSRNNTHQGVGWRVQREPETDALLLGWIAVLQNTALELPQWTPLKENPGANPARLGSAQEEQVLLEGCQEISPYARFSALENLIFEPLLEVWQDSQGEFKHNHTLERARSAGGRLLYRALSRLYIPLTDIQALALEAYETLFETRPGSALKYLEAAAEIEYHNTQISDPRNSLAYWLHRELVSQKGFEALLEGLRTARHSLQIVYGHKLLEHHPEFVQIPFEASTSTRKLQRHNSSQHGPLVLTDSLGWISKNEFIEIHLNSLHALEQQLEKKQIQHIDARDIIPKEWDWSVVLELPLFEADVLHTFEQHQGWYRLVAHDRSHAPGQVQRFYSTPEKAVERFLEHSSATFSLTELQIELLSSRDKGLLHGLHPENATAAHFGGTQGLLASLAAQGPLTFEASRLISFYVDHARALGLEIDIVRPFVEAGNIIVHYARRTVELDSGKYVQLFSGEVMRLKAGTRSLAETVGDPEILKHFETPWPAWASAPDHGLFRVRASLWDYVGTHAQAMVRWCCETLTPLEKVSALKLGIKITHLDVQPDSKLAIAFEDGSFNSGKGQYIFDSYGNRAALSEAGIKPPPGERVPGHPPEIAKLLCLCKKNPMLVGAQTVLSQEKVWSGTVGGYRDTEVYKIQIGFGNKVEKTVFLANASYGSGEDADGDNAVWETLKQAKTDGN